MKKFRDYNPEQLLLLPPSLREWLPEGHLATFVSQVVDSFDLSEFYDDYDGEKGGRPPYHPMMMVKVLCYAYCVGVPSSRRIEQALWESVPFRFLAADQHPDHAAIAEFRRRHLKALDHLFLQVLKLTMEAKLVSLENVSIDGTKVKADASRNKSFSLANAKKREEKLKATVERILAEAEAIDRAEDEKYGEQSTYMLPEALRSKEAQLKLIQELKEKMEKERSEKERQEQEERDQKEAKRPAGHKKLGRPKKPRSEPDPDPDEKISRNQTDYDSRIMRQPGGNWVQGYNAQIAVDGKNQIVLAANVTNECNDFRQLQPMVDLTKENAGAYPKNVTADTGYFKTEVLRDLTYKTINFLIPPVRMKGARVKTRGQWAFHPADAMRAKLKEAANQKLYSRRKVIVEPVFGQIKSAKQRFQQFSLRGLEKVKNEWSLVCMTHNLMKLHKAICNPG